MSHVEDRVTQLEGDVYAMQDKITEMEGVLRLGTVGSPAGIGDWRPRAGRVRG